MKYSKLISKTKQKINKENKIERKLKWHLNEIEMKLELIWLKVNKLKRDEMNRNEMKQNKVF